MLQKKKPPSTHITQRKLFNPVMEDPIPFYHLKINQHIKRVTQQNNNNHNKLQSSLSSPHCFMTIFTEQFWNRPSAKKYHHQMEMQMYTVQQYGTKALSKIQLSWTAITYILYIKGILLISCVSRIYFSNNIYIKKCAPQISIQKCQHNPVKVFSQKC